MLLLLECVSARVCHVPPGAVCQQVEEAGAAHAEGDGAGEAEADGCRRASPRHTSPAPAGSRPGGAPAASPGSSRPPAASRRRPAAPPPAPPGPPTPAAPPAAGPNIFLNHQYFYSTLTLYVSRASWLSSVSVWWKPSIPLALSSSLSAAGRASQAASV